MHRLEPADPATHQRRAQSLMDHRMPTPPNQTSTRHRQQVAAATLANLLTIPLPECWDWEFKRGGSITGQLAMPATFDASCDQLAQWAAALDDPICDYRLYTTNPGRACMSVTGTYQGQQVTVWDIVAAVSELDVAQLCTAVTA